MNRHAVLLTICLASILSGCSFAPKRDLSQLYAGNSRAQIHGVLGKPAASYRYQGHDVDVYAFFQGYSQAQQVMISSGKVMAVLSGTALVMVVDGILEEKPIEFNDLSPPTDPACQEVYEARRRDYEERDQAHKAELREQREAEALAMHEEHSKRKILWADQKLEPDDLKPKYRTDVRGETLHFDNHEDADGSRHLVFAVNYDADQKLSSVAFLTGMTKASGDAFGRGPETWFKKRGKFPLQDVRQSIFFATPEQIELQGQVKPLPPLQ